MSPASRLDRIDRKRVALLEDVAALSSSQLAAHPLPGKWSIREIIEHLVLAEDGVVGDFSRLHELGDQPRGLKNRALYVVVMGLLRSRIPIKVPAATMVPAGVRSFAELRETWDDHHRRLRLFVASLDRAGARRAIFRHPVTGPLSVSEGVRMLEAHLDSHILQVRRLARLLAGPSTHSSSASRQ